MVSLDYTREVLQRFLAFVQIWSWEEQDIKQVRLLLVLILLLVFIGIMVICPVIDVFRSTPLDWVKFADTAGDLFGRAVLVFWSFASAMGITVFLLQTLYGVSQNEARNRVWQAYGFGKDPELSVRDGRVVAENARNLIKILGGPGTLRVGNNSAVVTHRNGVHMRVLGAGDHILQPFEYIFAVLDLRPYVTTRQVNTQTKDGIPIQAEGEVEFRIRPGDLRPSPKPLPWLILCIRMLYEWWGIFLRVMGRAVRARQVLANIENRVPFHPTPDQQGRSPYPFYSADIIRATYGQSVRRTRTQETETTTWLDNVPGAAIGRLRHKLSGFAYDRLSEPEDARPDQILAQEETPRWLIQREVLNAIRDPVRRRGCVVTRFSLKRITIDSNLIDQELVDQIENQRLRTWQAEWERIAQRVTGAAESETQRLKQSVRAEAQAQMIRALLGGLPANADAATYRRLVLLRALAALEEIRLDARAEQFFPAEALRVIEMLRRALD